MVLSSVEMRLATVQAQAMACGCPVIGTHIPEPNGFFRRSATKVSRACRCRRLQPNSCNISRIILDQWARSGQRALAKVQCFGGWHSYGEKSDWSVGGSRPWPAQDVAGCTGSGFMDDQERPAAAPSTRGGRIKLKLSYRLFRERRGVRERSPASPLPQASRRRRSRAAARRFPCRCRI